MYPPPYDQDADSAYPPTYQSNYESDIFGQPLEKLQNYTKFHSWVLQLLRWNTTDPTI